MSARGSSSIGFVILSHDASGRLLRLVRRLTSEFDAPRIVCHHDFSRCALDTSEFPSHVGFVRPHLRTKWGSFQVVRAAMAALRQLYAANTPSWFVLLSGSDYPVASAARILKDLTEGGADAYLDNRLIRRRYVPPDHTEDFGFKARWWPEEAFSRYGMYELNVPRPSIRRPFGTRRIRLSWPWLDRLNPLLRSGLQIYAGCHWFAANERCAAQLLDGSERMRRIWKYYRSRDLPDEGFYQTAICNCEDLVVQSRNFRYENWSQRGPHPEWLTPADVPAAIASGAHFARKFKEGSEALDLIDREIVRQPV